MNSALLSKWLYKLLTSDGMWQQLLRNKYIGSKSLAQMEWKMGGSHFWSCLMKGKERLSTLRNLSCKGWITSKILGG